MAGQQEVRLGQRPGRPDFTDRSAVGNRHELIGNLPAKPTQAPLEEFAPSECVCHTGIVAPAPGNSQRQRLTFPSAAAGDEPPGPNRPNSAGYPLAPSRDAVRWKRRDDGNMQNATRQDMTRGLLLMILSSSCFGVMGAAAKQANTVMSFWETTFWRGLITTAIVTALIVLGKRQERHDPSVARIWLWMRGLFGTLGVMCYFFAISRIPLAQAVMLNCTSPVFTTLLAAIFLKERLHPQRLIGLVVALVGAYLVVHPTGSDFNWGTVLGLCSGLFSGFAYVLVRRLSATQDPWVVVWHLAFMGIVLGAPGTAMDFHAPVGFLVPCILLMGVAGTVAQGAMTTAFRWLPAGAGATAGLMTVCVSALIGWIAFNEVPTSDALIGGALIITGGIASSLTVAPKKPLTTAEAS